MLSHLIQRPVAVLVSSLALVAGGILAMYQLPVSLLPPLETPRIEVQVYHPSASAQWMEEEICATIRQELSHLQGVEKVESTASNHQGVIQLEFRFGTAMDLAFLEVNEKIDYLLPRLPADMPRPQVVRSHLSDIPVFHLQIIPLKKQDALAIGQLAQKTISRRIVQIPGVSLVDYNGLANKQYEIKLKPTVLHSFGIKPETITTLLQESGAIFGDLLVREGALQYTIQLGSPLATLSDIRQLRIPLSNGLQLRLEQVAQLLEKPEKPEGYHVFNGKTGLVIRIFQQEDARMDQLATAIEQLRDQLETEFPEAQFVLTRNQYKLLASSMQNLRQSLLLGGIFSILILVAFYRNAVYPFLMAISVLSSLLMTFLVFYFLGITLNILSLAGLTLGIGMMIDNSIVVLDYIDRKRGESLPISEACVQGIREAMPAVSGQVLTTAAVYAPLVLLGGKAGVLLSDQALALSVALGISLLTSFLLTPVLFSLFSTSRPHDSVKETKVMQYLIVVQTWLISQAFRRSTAFLILSISLAGMTLWLAVHLPGGILPAVKEPATYWHIQWNSQVTPADNLRRICEIHTALRKRGAKDVESDPGLTQYILDKEQDALHTSTLLVHWQEATSLQTEEEYLENWIKERYPEARLRRKAVPNAFTYLFQSDEPILEARFRELMPGDTEHKRAALQKALASEWVSQTENSQPLIHLLPDQVRMQQFGISYEQIRQVARQAIENEPVYTLKQGGEIRTLTYSGGEATLEELLRTPVWNQKGKSVELRQLLKTQTGSIPLTIRASEAGPFYAFWPTHQRVLNWKEEAQLRKTAQLAGFSVEFSGKILERQKNQQRLPYLLGLSLALLYLILAVQFEHLVKPLLVMLVMPVGLLGSLALLYYHQLPIDLMAGIGIVVVLGIITDDPILKIHTIQLVQRQEALRGTGSEELLEKASVRCLKPLLVTSLTTILALLPVLYASGLGAELQRPLVLVVVGGLGVGTIFSMVFIPWAYRIGWRIRSRWVKKNKR